MKNIFKVFLSDARRLWTNVVAVVVIMGLAVIPCLYAWFNILSNWDPYGTASTSQIKIAVVSVDKGTKIDDISVNIGDMVISNLKENNDIDWQFVDTEDQAVEGVRSGKYYAAFVVESDFSKDMVSFIGGNVENPTIQYYENEKINAIAPKITSKVKTTVQNEINSAFVSTLAKYVLKASNYVTGENSQSTNLLLKAEDSLEDMDRDIIITKTMVNAYISVMDSSTNVTEAIKLVTNELSNMDSLSKSAVSNSINATNSAQVAYDVSSNMIIGYFDSTISSLEELEGYIDDAEDEVNTADENFKNTMSQITSEEQSIRATYDDLCELIVNPSDEVKADMETVDKDFDKLEKDLAKLSDIEDMTKTDALNELEAVNTDVKKVEKDIKTLKDGYVNDIDPMMDETFSTVKSNLEEAMVLLNYSSDSIDEIKNILDSYPDMMKLGRSNLVAAVSDLNNMQTTLENLIDELDELDGSSQYKLIMTLCETDPDIIADFISEPVSVDTVSIYGVENNGSGTAPFYVVLSIWVGALIMVAIIHTKVKLPVEGIENLTSAQEFFGRYLVFFLIGQLQTIITSLGAIFYVGIQCEHPVLFVIGCQITSLVFTMICYSLTFAFEAVGEAAGVVLMVLQVAGAGGTFPIEVMPKVYQVLYDVMPFKYGMMALRECIAGFYGKNYWIDLGKLCLFIPVCLIIGIVIGKYFRRSTFLIKRELESTDLMK